MEAPERREKGRDVLMIVMEERHRFVCFFHTGEAFSFLEIFSSFSNFKTLFFTPFVLFLLLSEKGWAQARTEFL